MLKEDIERALAEIDTSNIPDVKRTVKDSFPIIEKDFDDCSNEFSVRMFNVASDNVVTDSINNIITLTHAGEELLARMIGFETSYDVVKKDLTYSARFKCTTEEEKERLLQLMNEDKFIRCNITFEVVDTPDTLETVKASILDDVGAKSTKMLYDYLNKRFEDILNLPVVFGENNVVCGKIKDVEYVTNFSTKKGVTKATCIAEIVPYGEKAYMLQSIMESGMFDIDTIYTTTEDETRVVEITAFKLVSVF